MKTRKRLTDEEIKGIARRRGFQCCEDGDDCGHTELEHIAFDRGVIEGELGEDRNPYSLTHLRESWFSGQSVGIINQQDVTQ
jgi:hypothetical protein